MFDLFARRQYIRPSRAVWTSPAPRAAALEKENRELHAELLEQARLLGMSSEREAALLGRLERLQHENLRLQHELSALKGTGPHGA